MSLLGLPFKKGVFMYEADKPFMIASLIIGLITLALSIALLVMRTLLAGGL